MAQPLGNCPGCGADEPFEQVHAGQCPDVGGECPEWACTGCGAGVFMGTVIMGTVVTGTVARNAVVTGTGTGAQAATAAPARQSVRAALPRRRIAYRPPAHRVLPGTTYAQAMRLADTPAPVRASGQADAVPAGHGGSSVTDPGDSGPLHVFAAALAAFKAGADAVAEVRDDLTFEDLPAPRRLAPHAAAMAATAYRDGVEAGTGRLVLLHDPAGQEGWTGTFRLVAQVHADVEEEMAADPLLGEVGWSWLTDALDLHAPGYSAPSGTVTRVITEGYGAKSDEPPLTALEMRASWCPADDEIDGAVVAWCDLLVAAAGLPAQPPGTLALNARAHGPTGRRRR